VVQLDFNKSDNRRAVAQFPFYQDLATARQVLTDSYIGEVDKLYNFSTL
jgi:hypothetical protein